MNNKDVQLIKYQEYATITYEIALVISFFLLYDDEQKKKGNNGLFKNKTRFNILLFNRTAILIICLVFLYSNYENYKQYKNQDTSNLELQLIGSSLVLLAALISIYVVIKDYNKNNVSEFENIEI